MSRCPEILYLHGEVKAEAESPGPVQLPRSAALFCDPTAYTLRSVGLRVQVSRDSHSWVGHRAFIPYLSC